MTELEAVQREVTWLSYQFKTVGGPVELSDP